MTETTILLTGISARVVLGSLLQPARRQWVRGIGFLTTSLGYIFAVIAANVARDYPKPSEWWIGLLMLDPAERGHGFGAEVHCEIVEWIAAQGGTTLWLAAQTQNEPAQRFWLRMGYLERERRPYVGGAGLSRRSF